MELRLSIIVPLYNSATWLPKCVESLIHQDLALDEYEIILVNDGSPDNSQEIAESYARLYSNIVVLSQQNKGTSGARNTGLRYASGKYVSFVDPDDYIRENSLGGLLKQMEEESLDMLRFNYILVDEQYQRLQKSKGELAFDYSPRIMTGCEFIGQRLGVACYVWAYIYKLSLIKDNEIWCVEGDYFDDTSWLPLVLMKAERFNCTDYEHYFYLQRSDSLVKSRSQKSIDAQIEGQFKLLNTLKIQQIELSEKGVTRWYNNMISHSSLSLLTLIAIGRFQSNKSLLHRFRKMNILPLSIPNRGMKSQIKIGLINISPVLFCYVVHKINTR